MDLYNRVAAQTAARVTQAYSTSFSLATRLFPRPMRFAIYNIYGLVRLADEIVDTYRGADQLEVLDALEAEVYRSIPRRFSSNLIVHAFAVTAAQFGIDHDLIAPFFASMRRDITQSVYDAAELEAYIYGSAEVVGLMCLRVFAANDPAAYDKLEPGAKALGAAFQKVNFLRDLAADHNELGRNYFPGVDWDNLTDSAKRAIEKDIAVDFRAARQAIDRLPGDSRPAVLAAYRYYHELFARITRTSAAQLRLGRVRLPAVRKLFILGQTAVSQKLRPNRTRGTA